MFSKPRERQKQRPKGPPDIKSVAKLFHVLVMETGDLARKEDPMVVDRTRERDSSFATASEARGEMSEF